DLYLGEPLVQLQRLGLVEFAVADALVEQRQRLGTHRVRGDEAVVGVDFHVRGDDVQQGARVYDITGHRTTVLSGSDNGAQAGRWGLFEPSESERVRELAELLRRQASRLLDQVLGGHGRQPGAGD